MILLAALAIASQNGVVIRPSARQAQLSGAVGGQMIRPPFKRVQSMPLGWGSDKPLVSENAMYAFAPGKCIKYDLRTFKPLWTRTLKKDARMGKAIEYGGNLYTCDDTFDYSLASKLYCISAATGDVKWTMNRVGRLSAMAAGSNTLYVSLKPYCVSALNLKTRKTLWTTRVSAPHSEDIDRGSVDNVILVPSSGPSTAAPQPSLIATSGSSITVLNPRDGKMRWQQAGVYFTFHPPVVYKDLVWMPQNFGSEARDIRSGKHLWSASKLSYGDFGGVLAGRLVGLENGSLVWVDPATGKELPGASLDPSNHAGGRQFGQVVGGVLVVNNDAETAGIDANGQVLWRQASADSIPAPIWSDASSIVCFDGQKLMRYVHGAMVAAPTDSAGRQALAKSMVGRFKDLDPTEVNQLSSLGDDAFEPVFEGFLQACTKYDAKKDNGSMDEYELYHSLADVLDKVTTARRSAELMVALGKEKKEASAKPFLLQLLSKYGEPSKVVPYFLKELTGETPGFEMYESATFVARAYIQSSENPAAVAFMMAQLKNPKADQVMREAAYDNLAGTGGVEGVKAVRSMRKKRVLLPSIEERMDLAHVDSGKNRRATTTLLSQKSGKDGRVWGLLQSGVLGSRGDLWLAEKVNGHWTHPRFLDVSLEGVSKWAKGFPERSFAGKTAKQLADGAWFDACVGNPLLDKDSGGSSLTDLEKKRLGLPLGSKDVDGDGDPDALDPWPNAASRELSDAEKVLAAAFEARYHFFQINSPAILFAPPDMKPFEMVGWEGPVIWQSTQPGKADFETDLSACYEQGVAFLRFTPRSKNENGKWEDTLISWNPEHTQATVGLSTYFGGLSGDGYDITVTKFGENWVVTSMRMAYVS